MNNSQDVTNSSAAPDNTLPALSPRQLAARRANALKSTGPRSSEGKEIARLNALKHGFFSCDVVNSVLDGPIRVEEFTTILDALLEEYDPQSVRERILIDEVAACCWRIRRLLRYECREAWVDDDNFRRRARTETPSEAMAALMGHDRQTARERAFRKLKRAGLETFILPSERDIDKIVRYERLIKRNLYRALYTLERIRAARQVRNHLTQLRCPSRSTLGEICLTKTSFDGTNLPMVLRPRRTTTRSMKLLLTEQFTSQKRARING